MQKIGQRGEFATFGPGARMVLRSIVVASVYFLAARFSLLFVFRDIATTPVWFPSGVAVAAVLMYGEAVLPGIVIGDLAAGLSYGSAPAAAIGIALAGALEAVVGARLLQPQRGPFALARLGVRTAKRFFLSAVIAPIPGTLIGTAAMVNAGTVRWDALPRTIGIWWTGDVVGILLATPVCVLVSRLRPGAGRWPDGIGLALIALTIATAAFVFSRNGIAHSGGQTLAFVLFPLLTWGAFVFTPTMLTLANLAVALIAVIGTSIGLGPYALTGSVRDVWALQGFVAAAAGMSLMLRAALEDRTFLRDRSLHHEGRFRAVADHGEHLVLILQRPADPTLAADSSLRLAYANRVACERLLGGRDDVRERTLSEVCPALATSVWSARFDEVLRARQAIECEEPLEAPGRAATWFRCTAIPVDNGLMLTLLDVTAPREAARALVETSEHLRVLSRRLLEVEEAERRSLSRELHDRIGQNLFALNLNLDVIGKTLPAEARDAIATRLDVIRRLLGETSAQVRNIMAELHPPGLEDYGLIAALRAYTRSSRIAPGPDIAVLGEEAQPRLARVVEMGFFRIAQEALTNALKHARARRIEVSLVAEPHRVALTISDDGDGIDAEPAVARRSWGLTIMRERAESLGADLVVSSTRGRGTRVTVTLDRGAHE